MHRTCLARHHPARHERARPHRGGARGVGVAVARRLVGAVTAAPSPGRPDRELRPPSGGASRVGRDSGRRDDGHRRAQRRGQEHAPEGAARAGAAHRRPHRMHGQAHRLPAAAGRDRPLLPDLGVRHGAARPLVAFRRLRRGQARRHPRRPARHRSGRAFGLRAPADRHALGRPVPARAVRPRAAAGRRSRPAGRAVRRHRFQDRRRPHGW